MHPNWSQLNILEKGAWAYPVTAQIFWVPPIISGMGKATDFKFFTHIHRVNQNKSPWKILGKVAMGIVRESQQFLGHPCMGRIAQSSKVAIAQFSCLCSRRSHCSCCNGLYGMLLGNRTASYFSVDAGATAGELSQSELCLWSTNG